METIQESLRKANFQPTNISASTRYKIDWPEKLVYCQLLIQATQIVTERGMKMDRTAVDAACRRIASWFTNPGTKMSLILSGLPGTGKTTLLKAIARMLTRYGYERQYYIATDLPTVMVDTPENFRRSVLGGHWALYLLLDDIGEEPVTVKDYGRELPLFTKIVAERYDKMLPMIITTNLSPKGIEETYGVRTMDRLREIADVISFRAKATANDRRYAANQQIITPSLDAGAHTVRAAPPRQS